MAEKDIKRKRRKIRGGPSGERNRKVKSSRYAEKTEAGRNTQTMTHPTSSLTGTTRSPRAPQGARGGLRFCLNITRAPPHPKANKEQDTTPEKRALRRPFPVLFPLFSFFPFPFSSLPFRLNTAKSTTGNRWEGLKSEGQKQPKK